MASNARPQTIIALVRHGEVDNPHGVLYGRLEGFSLSKLGFQMAKRAGENLKATYGRVDRILCSPLLRARQTAGTIAEELGFDPRLIEVDERLLESTNCFEGKRIRQSKWTLAHPKYWRYYTNPWQPSWGEPFAQVADRMSNLVEELVRLSNLETATSPSSTTTCSMRLTTPWSKQQTRSAPKDQCQGENTPQETTAGKCPRDDQPSPSTAPGETSTGAAAQVCPARVILLVTHQNPIVVYTRYALGKRLFHLPGKRNCSLCSITSFHYQGLDQIGHSYVEPAWDLLISSRDMTPGISKAQANSGSQIILE